MNNKTHYRKAFNSPYLSAQDLTGPTVLTVARVTYEKDKTKRSKESFNTLYFEEQFIRPGEKLKPMILNSGNTNIVKSFCSPGGEEGCYLENWKSGVKITVFALDGVRQVDGTKGKGLRISPEPPKPLKQELLKSNEKLWNNAVSAYKRDGNLNKVLARMTISEENQKLIISEAV